MVPAETGSASAAVVNAAAVSVSKIFMGSSPLMDPSPLAQRLRESPVALQQQAFLFLICGEFAKRAGRKRSRRHFVKTKSRCAFSAFQQKPRPFGPGFCR